MQVIDYVFLGLLIGSFLWVMLKLAARRARICQMCKKPRDPNSKVVGTWKYGVLACDDCGRKLEARFKDEDLPPEPPPWARP